MTYTKAEQLARGPKRNARKRAGRAWAAVIQEATALKGDDCRLCRYFAHPDLHIFRRTGPVEWHHIVPRSQLGDDCADNLVALHRECHRDVTEHVGNARERLAFLLTRAEIEYCAMKCGPGWLQAAYGVCE